MNELSSLLIGASFPEFHFLSPLPFSIYPNSLSIFSVFSAIHRRRNTALSVMTTQLSLITGATCYQRAFRSREMKPNHQENSMYGMWPKCIWWGTPKFSNANIT